MKNTLYDKLWNEHHIHTYENGYSLIYIDKHLIHEVTSPQAFEGLRQEGRNIWNKKSIMAVPDHNVPTTLREHGIKDPISKIQVDALNKNCKNNNLLKFDLEDKRQGIVHVVGPEQGILLPGMTVVCGDSHTSTHGALAALAFGIGTSEVEHVLATQCLLQKKSLNMNINIDGAMPDYFYSKDLALLIISKIGTAGGTGCAIEYTGQAIKDLSMEARMTLCNMTIEAGATTGLVAVDDKTINYVENKPYAPKEKNFLEAKKYWKGLVSDNGAKYDKAINIIELFDKNLSMENIKELKGIGDKTMEKIKEFITTNKIQKVIEIENDPKYILYKAPVYPNKAEISRFKIISVLSRSIGFNKTKTSEIFSRGYCSK